MDKQSWPPRAVAEEQLELPLPPRPGIKTRRFGDLCPKCRCLHSDAASVQACRSMTAQREQL